MFIGPVAYHGLRIELCWIALGLANGLTPCRHKDGDPRFIAANKFFSSFQLSQVTRCFAHSTHFWIRATFRNGFFLEILCSSLVLTRQCQTVWSDTRTPVFFSTTWMSSAEMHLLLRPSLDMHMSVVLWAFFMVALCNRADHIYLWPPCVADADIIFCPVVSSGFFLLFFLA